MKDPYQLNDEEQAYVNQVYKSNRIIAIFLALFVFGGSLIVADFDILHVDLYGSETNATPTGPIDVVSDTVVVDGIHLASGLIAEPGYKLVLQNCGGCHSHNMVTQNRGTKQVWLESIRWMQATQKLWDLGDNEEPILEYLSTYYAPDSLGGRRQNLKNIEWYELDQ